MNKKVYSQEEYDRMHNEVCKTANLTPEELAECAKVTVGQATKFFADQKAKILAAAAVNESARVRPMVDRKEQAPDCAEVLSKALEEARDQRDEWAKRYNNLKTMYDDVTQQFAYSEQQLKLLRDEHESALKRLDEAARMLENTTAITPETALKIKICDILLERWELEHAGSIQQKA